MSRVAAAVSRVPPREATLPRGQRGSQWRQRGHATTGRSRGGRRKSQRAENSLRALRESLLGSRDAFRAKNAKDAKDLAET